MRNRKKNLLPIVVVLLVAVGVGLGIYLAGQRGSSPARPVAEKPSATSETQKTTREVKIYRVVVKDNEAHLRAATRTVVAEGSAIEMALSALVEQGDDADLANPIPKGTKLLGVDVTDGLAKVDFSREFKANFAGGSEAEGLIIQVIVRTMAQFDEVKKVQILVDGKPIDSLGHADLSEPLDVRWVSSEFNE